MRPVLGRLALVREFLADRFPFFQEDDKRYFDTLG